MTAYLLAVLLTFIVWFLFFYFSKRTRKEMLTIGALLTPFVILDIVTVPTYWRPETFLNLPVGIEGFLFTFFITGIAAVVYEVVFKRRYTYNNFHYTFLIGLIVPLVFSCILVFLLNLNVIYLFIMGFLFMAISEIIHRKDLLMNAIGSAIVFSAIYVCVFTLWIFLAPSSINWWNFDNLSSITIGVVPLEELLFCFSIGAFVGPLYEYLTDAHIEK